MAHVVLGTEVRALFVLGKHSTHHAPGFYTASAGLKLTTLLLSLWSPVCFPEDAGIQQTVSTEGSDTNPHSPVLWTLHESSRSLCGHPGTVRELVLQLPMLTGELSRLPQAADNLASCGAGSVQCAGTHSLEVTFE